jgi:hypothetical protein
LPVKELGMCVDELRAPCGPVAIVVVLDDDGPVSGDVALRLMWAST